MRDEGSMHRKERGSRPVVIGISCLHYRWDSLEEAFHRCLEEFGLDMIELSTTLITPEQEPIIASLAEEHEMPLGMHAWEDLAQLGLRDGLTAARRLLERCQRIGVRYLILHLGCHPDRQKGLQIVSQIATEVAADYEQAGVTLLFENHYSYSYKNLHELGGDPEDMITVFRTVDSPAVRFCLDYGHANMTSNILQFINQCHSWLAYTHVADNMGEHDDHLGYQHGTVPWEQMLTATLQTGFAGPYVIEFPESSGIELFQRFARDLRKWAKIWLP